MGVLVTGFAEFIGSDFIRNFFKQYLTNSAISIGMLKSSGNLSNLTDAHAGRRYAFQRMDSGAKRSPLAFILCQHVVAGLMTLSSMGRELTLADYSD